MRPKRIDSIEALKSAVSAVRPGEEVVVDVR
jgi:hypothetical protein